MENWNPKYETLSRLDDSSLFLIRDRLALFLKRVILRTGSFDDNGIRLDLERLRGVRREDQRSVDLNGTEAGTVRQFYKSHGFPFTESPHPSANRNRAGKGFGRFLKFA